MRAAWPLWLALAGCAEEPRPMIVVHPDGRVQSLEACARGCSAPTPDQLHPLEAAAFDAALAEVAAAPVGVETEGLDQLLFHAADLPALFAARGPGPLSPAHRAWLERELSRQTVDLGVRLVDEGGAVRGEARARIGLAHKQHLVLEGTGALGRVVLSGKTKRVGLHHLWNRW